MATTPAESVHGRSTPARILLISGAIILGLVVFLLVGLQLLNTGPGKAFVARQIANIAPESGLRIRVGRLEGSLYGRLILHDLSLSDPRGVFLRVPRAELDWEPTALLRRHILIDSLGAQTAQLLRMPALRETPRDPNEPILPDIDITVGRLAVPRIILEAPVAGRRHVVALEGSADIADGRARVLARGAAASAGDRLTLNLDAEPDRDRFDVEAALIAPAGGVIDGMTGLGRPLDLRLSGDGSWQRWQGTAIGRVGDQRLVDLRLTAQDGRFVLAGEAAPSLLLSGMAARLTAPTLRIDATAVMAERRVDTRFQATSPALDISGQGLVDLAASRFGNFRVNARLLQPRLLLDGMSGRDIGLSLALDGAIAAPTVDYVVAATQVGFNETVFEQVQARGRTTIAGGNAPIELPVSLTAARVVGVNAAVGDLLRNFRADGSFRITPKQLLADNISFRSDRLSGRAVVAATFATGDYDVALEGTLNRYQVPGVGLVDVMVDAQLVPAGPRRELRVRAQVRARAVRLDNAAVRDFLGGLPTLTAEIERAPDGTLFIRGANLTAPLLRVTTGQGAYRPDGSLSFTAAGNSTQYGPLTLAVSGKATRPTVRLRMARPNVGVQLANVEALLVPNAQGYAITARGGSDYGPFAVDAQLLLGGATAVDIRRATIAGITGRGTIRQTAAGPYAGDLLFTGSGIDGTLRLSAAGRIQRADLALRANNARLPLPEPVFIARGSAQATALLYPNAPQVSGQATLSGVRRDRLTLASVGATINYQSGQGRAKLTATGRTSTPFSLSADASIARDRIRVTGSGSVRDRQLRLAGPAELTRVADGWRLAPTTLLLPGGQVQLSGTFARETALLARLDRVDLSILNVARPSLGVSGRASGTLNFVLPPNGAMPRATASLTINDLTRSGFATATGPIDIGVNAALQPSGGAVRALLRRQGAIVGQLQARLAPLPGGAADPWNERLLAAPLMGGLRFNGPAEALWALSGLKGHEIRGPIAIAADLGGRLSEPTVRGSVRASGLRYENSAFGTVINDIALEAGFTGSRLDVRSFTGRTGEEGALSGRGFAELSAARGYPIDFRVQLDRALVARRDDMTARVSGPIAITNDARGAVISGEINIDHARYRAGRAATEAIPQIAVRRESESARAAARTAEAQPPSVWRLAMRVRADNRVMIEGMGLESEWRANLRIGGNLTTPRILGDAQLLRGTFSFASRRFDLTRGIISFNGSVPPNPTLDIAAEANVEEVTAAITIRGTALRPDISFTSTPALPQDEVLSRLLFGSSVTELSATEAIQLASAVASLHGGSGGGFNPVGSLRRATGFDRLRIIGADERTGRGTSLAVGEHLGDDIYVEFTTDAQGNTITQLEITLTRSLSILSEVGSFGGTSASLRYSKDY